MIVLGTNSIKDTGFDVANSVRFEQSDAPYFQKTPTGDGNQRTFTFSVWLKMDLPDSGDTHKIFDTGTGTNYFTFYVTEEPKLVVKGRISGSTVFELSPTQVFRDPTAWFHLYIAVDTTQGTASNRGKIYINGLQVTDFGTATYPSQNTDFEIQNASYPFRLGADKNLGDEHYDGYMAEFVFVDGAAQAISDFGEFDEDSPTIWKPKDVSAIDVNPSHANGNGFYLNFQNSSNLGVDSSGNTNFSVNNLDATDQATDVPTNNFATLNPLDTNSNHTFSQGNCKIAYSASAGTFGVTKSTIGVSAGKWYWEVKYTYGNAGQFGFFDVNDIDTTNTADIFSAAGSSTFEGLAWRIDTSNNIKECANGQTTDTTDNFSSGNILGIAFDADNGKIYSFQNNTELTGQNIGAGTSLMTAVTVSDFYLPFISNGDGGSGTKTGTSEVNFGGCPAFSISSGNTDANGYGNFEYAPPSGYFSLCSKNLAEYGG